MLKRASASVLGMTRTTFDSTRSLIAQKRLAALAIVATLGTVVLLRIFYHSLELTSVIGRSAEKLASIKPPLQREFRRRTTAERERVSNITRCLNTKQGKELVTDSNGLVCLRKEVQRDGCCLTAANREEDDSCQTCHGDLKCCESYEYCVSCCLQVARTGSQNLPVAKLDDQGSGSGRLNVSEKKYSDPIAHGLKPGVSLPVKAIAGNLASLGQRRDGNVADTFSKFNQCAQRCRTNSKILLHGNQYRHRFTHCYWEGVEPVLPVSMLHPVSKTSRPGEDCVSTCVEVGLICHEDYISEINSCEALKSQFECGECVSGKAPAAPSFSTKTKKCFVNDRRVHLDCEGVAEKHTRLCRCIDPANVYR